MKIYQTIHKYAPHIPLFEKRNNITDETDISFAELQKLIIEDGYSSSYILLPAIEGKMDQVFFTLWDYDRLQYLWAKEHGLRSRNLSVIKHAQIEWYKPDVFYNHSAFCDNHFLNKYNIDKHIFKICWYGFVKEEPEIFDQYEIYLTLHRPFIKKWAEMGLKSYELQPAFDRRIEKYDMKDKPIDLLFYGQLSHDIFKNRNKIIDELFEYSLNSKFNIKIHLELSCIKKPYLNIPFFRRFQRNTAPFATKHSSPPLYGQFLYEAIGKSKYVINTYGDYNQYFKSNMRLFESLSCGSLLISEEGNYPDGFEANKNFIPFKNSKDLIINIPKFIENYSSLKENMLPFINDVKNIYSKENQWKQFKKIVSENC
jgi:hypothetical protein